MKDVGHMVTWDGGAVCGQELVLEGGEGGLDQQRHQEAECRRAAMNIFNLDNWDIAVIYYRFHQTTRRVILAKTLIRSIQQRDSCNSGKVFLTWRWRARRMWGWWCRSGIPSPGRRPSRSDSWFPPYWAPSSRPWRSWAQLWAGNYYPLIMLLLTTLCSPVTTPRIDLGVARQPPADTTHLSSLLCAK